VLQQILSAAPETSVDHTRDDAEDGPDAGLCKSERDSFLRSTELLAPIFRGKLPTKALVEKRQKLREAMGRTKTKTLEERQAFVRAVQANLERTGRKDIAGICRTHPGWKERTVAFYYRKFELAKSLHGAPRRGATDQAQLDDLAAQLEPDVLGKVLATLSSTRPAARLLGISKSAMQRRKGPLVRAVQRQQQQRPKDEFWYSRDPDALEKELHHLRKCCLDEKSLDLVMFLASEDNLCSLIVEAHNLHCTRMRLVIDEAQAKRRRNRQWLREFKGAGIPVKTGRTASTMVHNKWGSCWFANTIVLAGQVLRLTLVCNW